MSCEAAQCPLHQRFENTDMKKIGFVLPWYGDTIPGGAEMEARTVVKHLLGAGLDAEILTTCVKEFSADWSENYYPPGQVVENGVPVRRFRVRKRNTAEFDAVNRKLIENIPLYPREERVFMKEMVNSPELYEYITQSGDEYDLFVFIPYMFGTTFFGCLRCPEKAVLIPCFHEEAYIHMRILKTAFEHVAGIIYNAEPEKRLANSVFNIKDIPQIVMGIGMDTDLVFDAERFRNKYGIRDPFLLYAGRKDVGKNVDTLITYFDYYLRNEEDSDLKLVLIGGGKIDIPSGLSGKVIDLGFVDPQDKYDANAAALALCQPSVHESFSLVIMESWLCGRPVLVHSDCEVTKDFTQKANAGLYFHDFPEFKGCVDYLLQHEDVCRIMGNNGRSYVKEQFNWNTVVGRYIDFFREVIGKRDDCAVPV